MKLTMKRAKDGSAISVAVKDLGIRRRRGVEVYVTKITIGNRRRYSRVPTDIVDLGGHLARMQEDNRFLLGLGVVF